MLIQNKVSFVGKFIKNQLVFANRIRFNSTTTTSTTPESDLPFIVENKNAGYAIFKLNKAPVNSLSLESLQKLNEQLDNFENDSSINGVILTSNVPTVFSSGVDLLEMYKCKPERLRLFWAQFQNFWIKLYGSKKVYVAAINGHAPAAGCLLAMSCDYRIMSKGKYTIGISASRLGIKPPFWIRDTMINTIGSREAEKALQIGKLYTCEEALKINLVDEICEPDAVLSNAELQMQKWLKIPVIARQLTKQSLRKATIDKLISQKEADIETFVDDTSKDYIQKSLEVYLEALKNRKRETQK